MNEKFGKEYKLCSKKLIAEIFEKGKHVKAYPYFLHYLPAELNSATSFQVVISAPKRNFKKAVDRNRIKRLTREAVRKNKHLLESAFSERNQKFALFLIYTGKEEESFQTIMHKIETLFMRLVENTE